MPVELNRVPSGSSNSCYRPLPELAEKRPTDHEHADVLGVKVSAIDMGCAVALASRWIENGRPGYVCVASVHSIVEARRDPELMKIFNRAVMTTPDGMPLTWVGRLQGFKHMDRVFGPDFMMEMCRISVGRGHRHFLYGGRPDVAQELSENLKLRFPGIEIVGICTPPFRRLTADEERVLEIEIARAKPDIVWVGIGAPKQERFMAEYVARFKVPLMVGVGAAFDFHTGRIRDSAGWVKRAGLQWLHRLIQEPRRLWRRYLFTNPAFLWLIACQLCRPQRRQQAKDRPRHSD
jgi:N-acetylglucosaminyldiphosphoundecaprenol N-acetyl-beta-D-mannosaminyltransferase